MPAYSPGGYLISDAQNPFLQGTPVFEEVVAALASDSDLRVRTYAAIWLGRYGPRSAEAVNPLIQALDDPSDLVGAKAAEALGFMGEAGAPAAVPLGSVARRSTGTRALAAAEALASLGPVAREAAPALFEALLSAENRPHTGEAIANALLRVAADDPALPEALARNLRLAAARRGLEERPEACAQIVDQLSAAAATGDYYGRKAAIKFLGRVGPSAARTVPALYGIMEADPSYRTLVSEALQAIRPKDVVRGWNDLALVMTATP